MKLILILLFTLSSTAFATPAYLKCNGDIEIDFQSNWLRSSYVILDTTDGADWFVWTGSEPSVSGEEIKTLPKIAIGRGCRR